MKEKKSLNEKYRLKDMENEYMEKLTLNDLDKMYRELKRVSLADVSIDVIEESFFFDFVGRLLKIAKDNEANLYSANSIINEYIEERNNVTQFLKSVIFDGKNSKEQQNLATKVFRILEGGTLEFNQNTKNN